MTRKDYILLANVLRATRPSCVKEDERTRWLKIRDELCTALTRDNVRFSTVRFIDATEQ